MQPDEPNLPQGWELAEDASYYHWTGPEKDSSPDVYIIRSVEDWEIEYWVDKPADWIRVLVPLTPEPPFELAEALYYAAQ